MRCTLKRWGSGEGFLNHPHHVNYFIMYLYMYNSTFDSR